MSWSIPPLSLASTDEFDTKVPQAVTAYQESLAASDYELDAAAKEQIAAAIAAAKSLVASSAVGSGAFTVSMSGHANPEHKPVKGWANDCVTVYVTCADVLQAD